MRSNFRTLIRPATFLEFLVPLLALTVYLVLFSMFLAWLVPGEPAHVTSVFINRFWKLAAVGSAAAILVFGILCRLARRSESACENPVQSLRWGDGILILLPLAPVVQYVLNNQNILSPGGSLFLLGVFGAFSALFIIGVPAALSRFGRVRSLVFLGLAFTFTVTNMASVSAGRNWLGEGHFGLQLALFGGVFLLGLILSERIGRRFAYFVVALYCVSNSATQLIVTSQEEPTPIRTDTSSRLVRQLGSRKPLVEPNIYLMVYDAYVCNETMAGYGLDNSAQERYLAEQGFSLYPHTYSMGGSSVGTMSRVLNAGGEYYGEPRSAVSGNGVVLNLLGKFGYETHGVFSNDYFFQTAGANYDQSYPHLSAPHLMLMKAIFMGEFRFDIEFDRPSRQELEAQKARLLEHVPEWPRLVYMHDNLPGHSQNSGKCLPNEIGLYADRLALANQEMKRNLSAIEQYDPGALVVVAGDHGPYLTKNCYLTWDQYDIAEITRLDIQDRYGSFLAIKWPVGAAPEPADIVTLQDLFPAIFAYLFADRTLLDVRDKPSTKERNIISGAGVLRGVIRGGVHDGEPLYLGQAEKP